jgi:hypothetical protein
MTLSLTSKLTVGSLQKYIVSGLIIEATWEAMVKASHEIKILVQ